MNIFDNRDILGHSIVFVGDFNPPIFHPSWLSKHKIISDGEAESTPMTFVHKDIAMFQTSWLEFQVTRERLKLSTTNEALFPTLKDTAIMTFEILKHTPIRKMGVNFDGHFNVQDNKELSRFFDKIAPAGAWGAVFKKPVFSTITVSEEREGSIEGSTGVKIEQSKKVTGLYFQINNHFDFGNDSRSTDKALEVLRNNWEDLLRNFNNIVTQIWETNK